MTLFLIIPTLKQGGAERVMSELANQFASNNQIQVHLVLLAKSNDFYFINEKVIIHRLGFENKGKFQKIRAELKTFFVLRKLLRKHKPDAVLSFMEKYNSFTILASSFLGLKVFVSDRSNPLKKVSKSTELLRKLTYKYATGIIAQTELAKQVLLKKTNNKNIKVIPNPIKEIESFRHIQRENIVLNVGRLVPEKGQKYLLEAFSQIDGNENWKVVILGDGPLRSELEEQVNTLGLNEQVQFLGAVNNVDEWLAKASIFVFPSISEGFPNALTEAMGAGLPCVSFDCDAGPRDVIIHGENGFLIPIKDTLGMSKEINNLINNKYLRQEIGENAKNIRLSLNKNIIAKEYLNFLSNK